MPDEMGVPTAFADKEKNAAGISDSTGHQPGQTRRRHVQNQWPERDQNQPAHSQVERHRKLLSLLGAVDAFQNDTEDRERPNECEDRPAPRAAERPEREWRISPGDEQKNRRMVD